MDHGESRAAYRGSSGVLVFSFPGQDAYNRHICAGRSEVGFDRGERGAAITERPLADEQQSAGDPIARGPK